MHSTPAALDSFPAISSTLPPLTMIGIGSGAHSYSSKARQSNVPISGSRGGCFACKTETMFLPVLVQVSLAARTPPPLPGGEVAHSGAELAGKDEGLEAGGFALLVWLSMALANGPDHGALDLTYLPAPPPFHPTKDLCLNRPCVYPEDASREDQGQLGVQLPIKHPPLQLDKIANTACDCGP